MGASSNIADPKLLEDAVNAVRQRFLDALYERILMLEALAEQVPSIGPSELLLKEIAGCCHKLAGTAPTLGFDVIGTAARNLETGILSQLDNVHPDAIWTSIEEGLEDFLNLLEATLDECEKLG